MNKLYGVMRVYSNGKHKMKEVWLVLSRGRNFDDADANDTKIMGVYSTSESAKHAMKSFMTNELIISGLPYMVVGDESGSVAESAEDIEDENAVGIDYWISRYEVK